MVFDLDLIKKMYAEMPGKIAAARKLVGETTYPGRKDIIFSSLTHSRARLLQGEKIMWILPRTVLPCRMQRHKWPCCNL